MKNMKTNKSSILPLAVALAMVGSAASSSAAIVIDTANAVTFSTLSGAGTYTYTNAQLGNFDATVYDKLVFVASAEAMNDVTTVTYGGATLTEAITGIDTGRVAAIWFLDNPTVNGSLFIDGQSNGNGVGGTLFGLTGTQAGYGNVNSVGSGTTNATNSATLTASLGSIVIGVATGNTSTLGVGSPQTTITLALNSGSSNHSAGYQFVDPAGSVTATFTTSRVVAAAEFLAAPIPEPSSAVLLGLGGVALLIHRRRTRS